MSISTVLGLIPLLVEGYQPMVRLETRGLGPERHRYEEWSSAGSGRRWCIWLFKTPKSQAKSTHPLTSTRGAMLPFRPQFTEKLARRCNICLTAILQMFIISFAN